jgi:hypothetical protein
MKADIKSAPDGSIVSQCFLTSVSEFQLMSRSYSTLALTYVYIALSWHLEEAQLTLQNPTGVDPTEAQWRELSDLVKSKKHFAFFDMVS